MNKVILSGFLTEDINLIEKNGIQIVSSSIAVKRNHKTNGQYQTDFINFKAFNQCAKYLSQYGVKGSRIEIVGSWYVTQYQDKSGKTQYYNECVVETLNIISSKEKETKEEVVDFNDLPF